MQGQLQPTPWLTSWGIFLLQDTGESRRHDGESREVESERVHRERKGSDREREGKRDKHRERRHREEAGPARDPTERTSAKKSSSSSDLRVHKDKTEPVKTKVSVTKSIVYSKCILQHCLHHKKV